MDLWSAKAWQEKLSLPLASFALAKGNALRALESGPCKHSFVPDVYGATPHFNARGVVGANECVPSGSDFNARSALPLPTTSEPSGSVHLSCQASSVTPVSKEFQVNTVDKNSK